MNSLQTIALTLFSALLLIDRFLCSLPDTAAAAVAGAALVLFLAGMIRQRKGKETQG